MATTTRVEDTTKRNPLIHLAGATGAGAAGYIEEMEAAGQSQVVHSEQIPRPSEVVRTKLEAIGFTFATDPAVPGDGEDDLFVDASLPDGWSREASDHSMWSYVVDAEGRRRVGIFYKAAFYDRRAEVGLVPTPDTAAQREAWERVQRENSWHYSQDAPRTDEGDPVWASQQQRTDLTLGTTTFYMRKWGISRFEQDARVRGIGYPWKTDGPEFYWTFALDGSLIDAGQNDEPTLLTWNRDA